MKKNNIEIQQSLKLLENKIIESPNNYYFNNPATEEEIGECEAQLNIHLPNSYKTFLKSFNGGFICGNYQAKMIKEDGNFEDAQWNSNHIFGLGELCEAYGDKSLLNWKADKNEYDQYPFIPFCRTEIGELLIFLNPLKQNESPVFDACHEEFPNSWGILYNNFDKFLNAYILNEGKINTTSYNSPTAEEYLRTGKI